MPTDLTKLTVNLTPKALAALYESARLEKLSRTDIVNRALQVYAMLVEETQANGRELFLRDPDTGKVAEMRIL